jgi:DNA-damage-inducible protein D
MAQRKGAEMIATEIEKLPQYQQTMERLEDAKHKTGSGKDYWLAREINLILGYPQWREFEDVIERAKNACVGAKIAVANHFGPTHKMVEVGSGARRQVDDYFLSRAACYFIAMNGDPAKAEIAAAQAYFAIQTRRMEMADQRAADQQRLDMRDKVTESFKKVSGVAQDAGVVRQGIFHDARYRGLYGMSLRDVKRKKGVGEKENLLDRAGALELSANDFQMLLAAEVITTKGVRGEAAAITINERVGKEVRATMAKEGATLPDSLPIEPPIAEVRKRLAKGDKPQIEPPKAGDSST